MDTLRRIPAAVRWVSSEPLIEDISEDINLVGFHWVVTGGESGAGEEYLWDPTTDLKADLNNESGRRTMRSEWAVNLRDKVKAARLPFMFKQVTNPRSGYGYNALEGRDWHEFPSAPNGLEWAPRHEIPAKLKMAKRQWEAFMGLESRTYHYERHDGTPKGCARVSNDAPDVYLSELEFQQKVNEDIESGDIPF
jgi:hypothetical protein